LGQQFKKKLVCEAGDLILTGGVYIFIEEISAGVFVPYIEKGDIGIRCPSQTAKVPIPLPESAFFLPERSRSARCGWLGFRKLANLSPTAANLGDSFDFRRDYPVPVWTPRRRLF
jgi:hypothetical protein